VHALAVVDIHLAAVGLDEDLPGTVFHHPPSIARSDQVESPDQKERAQDQLLEHDLLARVVSTFADHALTRSSLHRCLQRHGIGRLPDAGGEKVAKKKFKV
jgi:hypothetical protein